MLGVVRRVRSGRRISSCCVVVVRNVHLRISLREMSKIPRPDALNHRKKFANRLRSLNLRLAEF